MSGESEADESSHHSGCGSSVRSVGTHSEITVVDLVVFDAGKEQFPVTYTVEPKSLI